MISPSASIPTPSLPIFEAPARRGWNAATLLYLALPLSLWLLFWLRLPLALGAGAALGWALWTAIQALPAATSSENPDENAPSFRRRVLWTYAPLGFFTLFCGAGGFGYIAPDWLNKHNILLADLTRQGWPVSYAGEGGAESLHLVYSIAYYLPAAALGKAFGWTAANFALQAWTQLGMLLLSGWIVILLGARNTRAASWAGWLFVLFSGADQLGHYGRITLDYFQEGVPLRWGWLSDDLWWVKSQQYYLLYRANLLQLFWAPQHLLAGTLGAALLLRPTSNDSGANSPSQNALVLALLPLWSPFAALGCVPIIGWNLWRDRTLRARQNWLLILVSIALCALLGLYFASRLPFSPGRFGPTIATGMTRGLHLEFLPLRLWNDIGLLAIPAYLLFDALEYALLLAFAFALLPAQSRWRAHAILAASILFGLKFFQYGLYNDLMMRSAIPALFIVFLGVALALTTTPVRAWKWRHFALIFLLFWGGGHFYNASIKVGGHLKRTLRAAQNGDFTRFAEIRPLEKVPDIYREYRDDPRRQLVTQYIGNDASLFARFLRRK